MSARQFFLQIFKAVTFACLILIWGLGNYYWFGRINNSQKYADFSLTLASMFVATYLPFRILKIVLIKRASQKDGLSYIVSKLISPNPFTRNQAIRMLSWIAGDQFGVSTVFDLDPIAREGKNLQRQRLWLQWWKVNKELLIWNDELLRYTPTNIE